MSDATRIAVSGTVNAPPEKTYRILADYRNHHPHVLPKPTFESLEVEKGGVGEGTVVRVVMRVMGSRTEMRMEASEPEPGRVLQERDLAGGAVTTFTVDPLDGGKRSRVTISTEWPRRPGLRGFVDRFLNPRVARPLYEKELGLLDAYAQTLP